MRMGASSCQLLHVRVVPCGACIGSMFFLLSDRIAANQVSYRVDVFDEHAVAVYGWNARSELCEELAGRETELVLATKDVDSLIGGQQLDGDHGGHVVRNRTGLSLIHISEPTRLGMISYAVFCLKKK